MRVLHVSHSAQPGGSNGVLLSLIRHAPAGVKNACVFLERGPVLEEAAALGVPARLVESGRAREPWKAPGAVRGLRSAVRELEVDLLFAHVSKAHPYSWAAARLERLPCLWWQHEHLGIKPRLQLLAGRLPARAVVCSASWTAEAQRERFPRSPVERVWPGPELPAGELPLREHTTGGGGDLTLGVIGRLQRWKRVELALRAMPAVLAEEPRARLAVVGGAGEGLDSGYPAELRDEARRLGVAESVEFTGQLPDGAARMLDLDVLVHCAEREPFGLVLVEAMLRGVPAVAPSEGGPAEIVRHGEDGLLVDPADAPRLAEAVISLGRDPERRAAMGAAGRERALSLFTAERMADAAWRVAARAAVRQAADSIRAP
jgi:glycosyltransferase involved in cell wall biosynthesis